MSDDNKLIYELLSDVRKKQDDHTEVLVEMKHEVRQNKDDLRDHMAQTRAVRGLVEQHREEWQHRLGMLESPKKFRKWIWGGLSGAGASVGAGILYWDKVIQVLKDYWPF